MQRRTFVKHSLAMTGGISMASWLPDHSELPAQIEILNPRTRVPVSFIIDDSTALVNMAYYGIPQFQEVFPENYKQDWRSLPREIPDAFVDEFLD
ncbi:MAG TPA: hypothetical protein VKZ56_07925 [Membranihabitans sp.]|nr:hypothetical protein [Membranihabitans sp.]